MFEFVMFICNLVCVSVCIFNAYFLCSAAEKILCPECKMGTGVHFLELVFFSAWFFFFPKRRCVQTALKAEDKSNIYNILTHDLLLM